MILQLRRLAACLLATFVLALAACGEPSPEALLASAKEALAQRDGKAAVFTLKTLLQKTPDSPEARFLLGSAFLDGGDGVSAIVELRKALDLKHPREVVVPALARAMVLEGQYEKLTAEFASLELADASATADLNTSLALAYSRQGKGPKALAARSKRPCAPRRKTAGRSRCRPGSRPRRATSTVRSPSSTRCCARMRPVSMPGS